MILPTNDPRQEQVQVDANKNNASVDANGRYRRSMKDGTSNPSISITSSPKKRPRSVSMPGSPSQTTATKKTNSNPSSTTTTATTTTTSSSSTTSAPRRRNRRHHHRVMFKSQHIIPYIHVTDFTLEERHNTWYTPCEMMAMKRQVKIDIDQIRNSMQQQQQEQHYHHHNDNEDENSCCRPSRRGLEHFFNDKIENSQRRKLARQIVLGQQQQQQDAVVEQQQQGFLSQEGKGNDQDNVVSSLSFVIAQHYKQACYESKMHAYLRGVQDAQYVKKQQQQQQHQLLTATTTNRDLSNGSHLAVMVLPLAA